MPSKKTKQKLIKYRLGSVARVIACISFLILTIIGISSLVRAMSLEPIANENGIPSAWKAASLGNPETITVPITYWDQRQDDCSASNRQFEWTMCRIYAQTAQQGIVKNTLGSDGLPIPAHATTASARAAGINELSENAIGHDPVITSDNFYQWFHETSRSKRVDRQVTFTRTGNNTYTYGGSNIFPLDDITFSDNDSARKEGHNFHFTAHLKIAMKIAANGQERFEFSGDDDVWVFLNNQLVLDIGGLHPALEGWFTVNNDGTITSYVETAGYQTYNIGLSEGDVVNLDFFYAERSTSESNTKITIRNMNWPISADSQLETKIVSKVGDTESNLVQNLASITNRDPDHPLQLERIAAYLKEDTTIIDTAEHITTESNQGYLPLSIKTLYYTTTPNDSSSWQPVDITAPANSTDGFNLTTPLIMTPSGNSGDTLYFRYFVETSEYSGTLNSQINFYTTLNGIAGVTYDYDKVTYTSSKIDTSNDHTVTINYLYKDGTEAAPKFERTYHKGEQYTVNSPEIAGHTADTNIISGVIADSDLEYTVYYIAEKTPEPEPPVVDPDPATYTVTVKYIYEDGTPAAESITQELAEGDEYTINSPVINDYTPDQAQVSGTIANQDIEHIVTYTRIPEPIVPSDSEIPDKPITPEAPTVPDFPPSQIIDDDLLYLAPLGEVAYIPNTGVVGDAVATIFEAGFAEVILSQGMVMTVLLIFATSFATWFSLRKYTNIDLARNYATKKNHPKMSTTPKVARARANARNAHATKAKNSSRKVKK